jgi:uncharacterized protein (TIGR03083 family)
MYSHPGIVPRGWDNHLIKGLEHGLDPRRWIVSLACAVVPFVSDSAASNFWTQIQFYRRQLADQLDTLQANEWDTPTRCDGWRVRDVIGHLVHLAEASQVSIAKDIFRNGIVPDKALSAMAIKHGQESGPSLAQRLRAASAGRFHIPGSPRTVVLGEIIVHGADALEPVGKLLNVKPTDASPVLDAYRRVGRLAFHSGSTAKVRLVATDTDWSAGAGPEVRGTAVDLVQLLANRKQVVTRLDGPGVANL